MGTECAVHVYASDRATAEQWSQLAMDEVERIEARYSRYRSDSDLADLNRVAETGGSIAVDGETAALLDYAYSAYEKSGRLFDVTSGLLRKAWNFHSDRLPNRETLDELLPRVGLDKMRWEPPHLSFTVPGMELDFGGIGKEYAADRAADVCRTAGARHGLVDLGGDIRIIGPHPSGQPWRIGIRHPRQPDAWMATAEIDSGALATSGDYERCIEIDAKRYGHILHPATGWPVGGLCSVSVIAGECLVAGTVCTIAMLKGVAGIDWLQGLGVPHVWMDEQSRQGSFGHGFHPA
ncbi:MAG: FAD:protein FMN transferase [Thermoguttaceae bacterium]